MTRRKPEAVFVTVNGRYRVEVEEGFEAGTFPVHPPIKGA